MSLHVEVRGHGPDLVLLHGWALHGEVWGPWVDAMAEEVRLHIVDLPGHGRSPWVAGATSIDGLVRAIDGQLPDGAALLGWSLGGMLALELARRRHTRALVLVATTPRFVDGPDWPHGMTAATLADFAGRLRDDYDRTVQNFLALQTRGDERALATLRELRVRVARRPRPAREALEVGLEILRVSDLRGVAGSIETDTLVVSGEHDRLTPPAACQWLAGALPRARHRMIAGAAHAPFLSRPLEFLSSLREFLAAPRAMRA